MHWLKMSILLSLGALICACTYEAAVTRVKVPGGMVTHPDPSRYGALKLVWVREFHKPTGLASFPDGGKARETAFYAVVYQMDRDREREVGRIHLSPVRRHDFGNLNSFKSEWLGSDRLRYRVEYGYRGALAKVAEGELSIPPLQ